MKSILMAGFSLLALATAAEARTFGHVAGNVNYVDQDFFSGKRIDLWKYGAQGAIGFDLTPSWNVQIDAAYNSDSYSADFFSSDFSVESYRAGAHVFWRDTSKGMFGVELAYQSSKVENNDNRDGFLAGVRGEYYSSDMLTYGGGLSYNTYDLFGSDADTWAGNLFVTYYPGDKVAVSLRTSYASTEAFNQDDNSNIWGVSADVEYLFQNNMSVSGVIAYSTDDYFSLFDVNAFTVGAKLKFYFGTEGSLANQHRTSTLESTPTDIGLILVD